MAEEKPKARKQSMLYEVCSLCNGTGVGPFGNGKCACKRLFVVETGATARQLEAVVEENGKLKARIAELEGQLKRSLDRAIDLAEEKRVEMGRCDVHGCPGEAPRIDGRLNYCEKHR